MIKKVFIEKRLTLIASIVCVVACVAAIVSNMISQQAMVLERSISSFQNTIVAMNAVVGNYLSDGQDTCDTWAKYISGSHMTLDEALATIELSNTNPAVSAHIIDLETYAGKSTRTGTAQSDYPTVSYALEGDNYEALREDLVDMFADDHVFNITCTFINPVTGQKVLAFAREVIIYDEADSPCIMALLRVIPSELFDQIWVFPTIYERTSIDLINMDGDFISSTKLTGADNFFDYINSCNTLSAQEQDTLLATVQGKEPGYFFYNTVEGERTLFIHSELYSSAEDWMIIGYIPASELESADFNFYPLLVLAITFILLHALNVVSLSQINRQLKHSIAETQRANEAKSKFLATMSHDIRTPMNAIIGMTAIAQKHIHEPYRIEECLKKINLSGNHLLTLINDILDISKIESGKYAINPVVFSLAELMDNIFNIVRQNIRTKNIDLRIRTHQIEHEYLFADQLRLNQIYINILTNAVKYTPVGGHITVDLTQSPSPNQEGCVRLVYRVEDTGIGMSEEFMGHMFDSFARETDSRTDTIQGTGLGLTITKQMVDLMHGTIDVESELNKGSVFTVTLDLPLAEHVTANIMLPPISMIVVDDDPALLESAHDTLKQIGIDADLADSGEKGLAMIRRRHGAGKGYQAVILDWKMPDISGLTIARTIRQEIGEDIPIIIVSAYDYTEIEDEARAAGVNGFISKPLFRSTLCKTLGDLLNVEEHVESRAPESYSIAGMRILIAEDNDVNYEIAAELLACEGAVCTRAENGKICVDKLEADGGKSYDLVLMDMQMPVMKGLDATRILRASENEALRTLPIIAMTADAFSENVSECLAAGMDGHIAKPISMNMVLTEIHRVMVQRVALSSGASL